jgi:hypothetical protein
MSQPRGYTLWIEAEEWAPGEWTPADDNTDVIVTFADASRWVATFLLYLDRGGESAGLSTQRPGRKRSSSLLSA